MAHLKVEEFNKIIECLAADHGLQRLRDKLVRLNALVTRRRAGKASALASQLYTLTGGLRRDVPATVAIHTLWAEQIGERLDEDGEKALEAIAEKINACLGEHDRIVEERSGEIAGHIRDYEARLAVAIGADRARIDMILKAVPDVASRLREMPLVAVEPDAVAVGEQEGDAEVSEDTTA